MNNIKYDGNDIDDIIDILNADSNVRETIEGTKKAIQLEEQQLERLEPHLRWYGPDGKQFTKEQYREMMRRQAAERIRQKSIGKQKIPTYKATFFDEVADVIKNHKAAIAGTLVAISITLAAIAPTLNANKKINDLSNKLGDEFVQMKYAEQQDGLFRKLNLTIAPDELVNNLGLTSNSHMRLYILSTVLQRSDFESVLRELGYNSLDNYVKKLGFEHGELRASEQYSIEYYEKLKNIIKNLNENPDKVDEYLEAYPELGLIFDPNNTFILSSGEIGSTRERGGRN